jgi:hypothetical protein
LHGVTDPEHWFGLESAQEIGIWRAFCRHTLVVCIYLWSFVLFRRDIRVINISSLGNQHAEIEWSSACIGTAAACDLVAFVSWGLEIDLVCAVPSFAASRK